jgi:hypothetical protein
MKIRSRSSMDRMTDSGSVGWAFESPRDHSRDCEKGNPFSFYRNIDHKRRRERSGGAFEPSKTKCSELVSSLCACLVRSEQSPRDHKQGLRKRQSLFFLQEYSIAYSSGQNIFISININRCSSVITCDCKQLPIKCKIVFSTQYQGPVKFGSPCALIGSR